MAFHLKRLNWNAYHTAASYRVFDRGLKRRQRDWAASLDDCQSYQYLRNEIAYRLADRVYDVQRIFSVAVDLGAGMGHIAPHIFRERVDSMIQVEMSRKMIERASGSSEVIVQRIHADEEVITFRQNSIDLIMSSLSMHWINNLPATFKRIYDSLRPDGLFLAALFGGNTLYELRCSLQLAEQERLGGMGSHLSPLIKAEDLGHLLNATGFRLTTLDVDSVVVNYPSFFALIDDLRGMAESQATFIRTPTLGRHTLMAASAIYKEMYANDNCLPATFQILYLAGWKPSDHLPKAAKRGSGQVSLKSLGQMFDKQISS